MTDRTLPVAWQLEYDASVVVHLPAATDDGDAWIRAAVEHVAGGATLGPVETAEVRATAQALLDLRRDDATQLWFAPPGVSSDILVTILVAAADDPALPSHDQLFDGATSATSIGMTELVTETHGAGFLVRRAEAISPHDPTVVAQWTARLSDGRRAVLVDAIGTTLTAFAAFERAFPSLLQGIRTPDARIVGS